MLSGNEYTNTNQKKYLVKEEKSRFIVDETRFKVGNDYCWIWVAIEPVNKVLVDIYLSSAESKHLCCREVVYILYLKNMENIESQEVWWYMNTNQNCHPLCIAIDSCIHLTSLIHIRCQ